MPVRQFPPSLGVKVANGTWRQGVGAAFWARLRRGAARAATTIAHVPPKGSTAPTRIQKVTWRSALLGADRQGDRDVGDEEEAVDRAGISTQFAAAGALTRWQSAGRGSWSLGEGS